MYIITHKKFFIWLSTIFVVLSIASVAVFGLSFGIDFKGGSQFQIRYPEGRPTIAEIKTVLDAQNLADATIQPVGDTSVSIKSRFISELEKDAVVESLSTNTTGQIIEENFTTVGPSVGAELKQKAIISITLVLIAIVFFVAYAFRKVSYPVSSWKYGFAVIIALVHDIAIPIGVYAVFGHFYGAQVDTLFVVALLTILALSISDTIVVFDRVREHLANDQKHAVPFPIIVGDSLKETFARSINTSLVVLMMVVTLALVGPKSTQLFATVLAIGMFFGTYSSIFLASPLLVVMEGFQNSKK